MGSAIRGTAQTVGVVLAYVVFGLTVAWLGAAIRADCQGTYCGPCPQGGACPYGCFCLSDGYCHSFQE